METISELRNILGQYLNWNKCRIDCFAEMLTALFKTRTVNLRKMANAMPGKTHLNSRYMRLKRFFRYAVIDNIELAHWIFNWFFSGMPKIYLTIDRTNWFYGKSKMNILTLAIAYEGIAIPLLWQCLNKAGNATAEEHIGILQKFIDTFGTACIAGVLGDREFANGKLFNWLNTNKIPFYIRIKDNTCVYIGKKKYSNAKKLFNDLNAKTMKPFNMRIKIYDANVYVIWFAFRKRRINDCSDESVSQKCDTYLFKTLGN